MGCVFKYFPLYKVFSVTPLLTSSFDMKEYPQECYAKLHTADVRDFGLGMHSTDSIHFTHRPMEKEAEQ